MTGASSYAPLAETQQQHRHQLVHRDAAIAATKSMARDAHSTIVRKTGHCNNRKQHAIGCEYLHIDVEDGQLTIKCTDGVCRELRDKFIAARNGKPPWLMKAFVRIVCKMGHHDVISSGIFAYEYCDKGPREWTKQGLKTLGKAMESYMVEVIAESSF